MNNLITQIEQARNGDIFSVPFIHQKLNRYLFMGKRLYHLIGGAGGSGKSAWIDQNYVLNPVLWTMKYGEQYDISVKVILRSMERSKELRKAKWICMKLFLDHKILIDTASMLAWGEQKSRVSDEVFELIKEAYNWVEKLEDHIEIVDGASTPTGIYQHMKQRALEKGVLYQYENVNGTEMLFEHRGKTKKKVPPQACPNASPFQPVYIPDNEREITIGVVDHFQTLVRERGFTDKANFDKMSEYLQILRDLFGYSPVAVSQLNRNVNDTFRKVKTDLLPEDSDFSGSSRMFYDCDAAGILFNPYKYNLNEMVGWRVKELVDRYGINRFRSFHLLKNTYGPENQIFGYNFIGENGIFIEMPPPDQMTSQVYEKLKSPAHKQKITKHG